MSLRRQFSLAGQLILLGLFLCTSVLFAGTATIRGIIKDAVTNEALIGANVFLDGTGLGSATDLDGFYIITNVPAGVYNLRVKYIGYQDEIVQITVKEDQTLNQNLSIKNVSVKGEAVEVTAQAEGQLEAINKQLTATSIVNVVSSARIQELPDANAAESVGRLPGVSIKRSGGEGNKVVIRGLSPKYNAVTVNGVKMSATGSGDRSTDMSMISPYLLQGIEVIKAITPDQEADVIGGMVKFKLKEAPSGIKFDAIAQNGYNGLQNSLGDYKYVFGASNRFFKNKFGVFAQLDLENRDRSADLLNVGYDIVNPSLGVRNRVDASNVNFQQVGRDKNRYGAALVMDYHFGDGSLVLSNFASKSATDVNQQKEVFSSSQNTHNYTISDNSNDLSLMNNALNFEYDFGKFRVDALLASSFSENESPLNLNYTFQEGAAFNSATGLENPFSIVDSAKNNLENTYIKTFNATNSFTKENQYTAALNMEMDLNLSRQISSKIKYGVKYRHQYKFNNVEKQSTEFQPYRYKMDSVRAHFPWMNNVDIGSSVIEKLPYQLFLNTAPESREFLGGQFDFRTVADFGLLRDLYNMLNTTPDNVRLGLDGAPLLWKQWPNSIRDDYEGTEDYSAAYLMSEFNIGNNWMILPGVRYERYRTSYTASRGDDARRVEEGYNYTDTTTTRLNDFLLPMLHIGYKATPWLNFRLAYTNTLSRPNFNRITPGWHLNSTSSHLTYNNFKLKPAESANYDFSVSVSENHLGFFNAVLFYKNIEKLVYNPGKLVIVDPADYDLPLNLGAETISTTINNKFDAEILGIELDWQTYFWYLPKPLNGVVFNINYTHMRSETKYPRNELREVIVGYDTTFVFGQERILPILETVNADSFYTGRVVNQPNDIINISLGYDLKGFSARMSMLYTDNILSGTNFYEELRSFTDTQVRWDLAIKQKLPVRGLQLYFNLNNFSKAIDRSLIAGNSNPSAEEHYDLTMDVGIRYRFK